MKEDGTVPENPLEQLGVALENVSLNLEAAGMTPRDLLKLTFYHVGEVEADKRQALLSAKLGDHKPCMTLLFVAALASPAIKIEVDVMASRAD